MSGPEFVTFGCRLNSFETEAMRAGASDPALDNAVVFNSCAVTAEAVRQARQAVRRRRRQDPDARIIVTGCAAQTEPETFAAMDEVDLVIGNREKFDLNRFGALGRQSHAGVHVADIMDAKADRLPALEGFGERSRAFVQVQNGCDHRCTFCVIPFGRGPSRSMAPDEVVRRIAELGDQGFREVVLTGVDITDYAHDGAVLGDLVQRILDEVPELARLRLSSVDPIEIDPKLIDLIGREARLMPHVHLSIQAGDNMILKRMKRRHAREDVIGLCRKLQAMRPDMAFGADLIAGFPTEDEAMFANTLALIEECGLTFLHVFPFSVRAGTPAAKMPQLPRQLVKERAARLRAAGAAARRRFYQSRLGQEERVLVETAERGHSEHFAPVRLSHACPPGEVVRARITGIDEDELLGEVLA